MCMLFCKLRSNKACGPFDIQLKTMNEAFPPMLQCILCGLCLTHLKYCHAHDPMVLELHGPTQPGVNLCEHCANVAELLLLGEANPEGRCNDSARLAHGLSGQFCAAGKPYSCSSKACACPSLSPGVSQAMDVAVQPHPS